MAEVVVFDLELQNNEAHPVNGPKNNSDSDDELLEIEEVRHNNCRYIVSQFRWCLLKIIRLFTKLVVMYIVPRIGVRLLRSVYFSLC